MFFNSQYGCFSSGERKHQCSKCGKHFQATLLDYFIPQYGCFSSGEGEHQCLKCGKRFQATLLDVFYFTIWMFLFRKMRASVFEMWQTFSSNFVRCFLFINLDVSLQENESISVWNEMWQTFLSNIVRCFFIYQFGCFFSGEREHQCSKCGKRFQALSTLTKVNCTLILFLYTHVEGS